MILKEITPNVVRCAVGPCPAIFRTDRGTYVLIGRLLSGKEAAELLSGRIASDETAIEVPQALLETLLRDEP